MAVSNIVLRSGVGPTATIALFVTHGLSAGSAPPVTGGDTHDGFRKKKPHVSDEEIQRIGKELRKKEAEKLAYAEQLRKQLQETINPSPELVEQARDVLTPAQFVAAQNDRTEALQKLLARAENELRVAQLQAMAHETMTRQEREEEEMRAILMTLTVPAHTVH